MGERVVEILKANPDQSFFFAFGAGESQGEVLGLFFFSFLFLREKGYVLGYGLLVWSCALRRYSQTLVST